MTGYGMEVRCVVCNRVCDESGLCDEHKYDDQPRCMQVSDFPIWYRLTMIHAYPVIAQMTAAEEYCSTAAERDAAFGRILANRNLRRTHELFLAEQDES